MTKPLKKPKKKRILEGRFATWLAQNVKCAGAMVLNVHGHIMQSPGWPDLQIYHRIWSGHIELKMDDEEPSTLQYRRMIDLVERYTNACWMSCNRDNVITLWYLTAIKPDVIWNKVVTPFKRTNRQTDIGPSLLHYLRLHVPQAGIGFSVSDG